MLANGVRDRISPELTYFYHSLGFAAQYYQQDQVFQSTVKKPPWWTCPSTGYYVLVTYLLTGEQRTDYSQQIDPIRPFDPSRRWLRRGPGNWSSESTGWKSASRHSPRDLPSDTGTTNRSSTDAIETTMGINWYLNKWVAGATQLGTCQLRQPREDRQRGERRLPKKTRCTRGSRSSSNNSLGVRSRSIRESFRWKMPSPRIFW